MYSVLHRIGAGRVAHASALCRGRPVTGATVFLPPSFVGVRAWEPVVPLYSILRMG